MSSTFGKKINIIFVYISEAHAVDVWPIGLSAGTLNYKHKTLDDRLKCANKFISEHNFTNVNINTYLDTIDNSLQNELSAWPFRYYVIESVVDTVVDTANSLVTYKFKYIPDPSDSEFNMEELFKQIDKCFL